MLVHDDLAFHNVAELIPAPGNGLHLSRFPRSTWSPLDSNCGDLTIRISNGSEIRFVTNARRVRLYLRSLHGNAQTVHLMGNHIVDRDGYIPKDTLQCVQIDLPKLEPNVSDATRTTGGFSPNVYRLYSTCATIAYHGVDAMGGDLRPPTAAELPKRRWLAYGSSITQGGPTYHNYVNAAAQMLEADAINLGMGGSCYIEKQISDFIASRQDWDFASFELGINMLNANRDNAPFAEKVAYLLDTVTTHHPGKPIFLITIFNCCMYHEKNTTDLQRDGMEKNDILRAAAARYPGQVHLLDGRELVPDFRGFQVDLVHPEPFASTRMGLALAAAISPLLQKA